jgi:hypothetical protein
MKEIHITKHRLKNILTKIGPRRPSMSIMGASIPIYLEVDLSYLVSSQRI